ncbi:cytochrome C assembly family protein [Thiohalomonas denitrificans]|uniref:ABC-type uncharacterized transport system, permease component n=1 Tax=Thiohalomonas denitrificans TaxID=415747 RepID=A0A1G5PJQ3_9GAMM|nr:cytochrome c biogenesis protein CcsA [Thiohalomonas denitrificans]SCZ49742.1 ABC-type uncharacterized transport system, permease component [Thiohalomonas denitrificans]
MDTVLVIVALVFYLGAAGLLAQRMARGSQAGKQSKRLPLILGFGAVFAHAIVLYGALLGPEALNLSFFNVLSLAGWLIALLILLSALGQPVENLAIAIFPIATLGLLAQILAPVNPTFLPRTPVGLEIHILLSLASYSLLAIAALQSMLLALQDRQLRNRRPGGFIRALPPLETMEILLFRLIGVGYLLLTFSLISGAHYLENIFAQHLVHKTVLSITAWVVFAVLIWGRLQYGWRGRTAIRWTLGGFMVLVLAYFGSKLVLELVLR